MNREEIIDLTDEHVMATYGRLPVAIVRGSGVRLWDSEGTEYLDFLSGVAVCNIGHCHPRVVEAIKRQAETLLHVSNHVYIEPQAELAKIITDNSFGDKVFFANSGAEVNEGAIKLARKYFDDRGEERFQVISMERSFHGRTMAAMAATGQGKVHKGFKPLLEKFTYVPLNDMEAVRRAASKHTAAILIEPIQGEGGVNLTSEGYLREIREFCDSEGILLIFDEVQVGMGRTGKLFAYEHFGVVPDIMTLAKGLGAGVAIGAMVATDEVSGAFGPGTHGSTFGGNPLSTAAALEAFKVILEEGVVENCVEMGAYLLTHLESLKKGYPFIGESRGLGLIIGLEIGIDAREVVKRGLDHGLLLNATGEGVLRFIPPLTINKEEIDEGMERFKLVLDTFL